MIAFFVPLIYPCTIGGLEIYYYHLVNELSKNNEVILFTTCKKYKNKNCRIVYISPNLFYIKKFNLGKLSLFIMTLVKLISLRKRIKVIHIPSTSNSGFYGYFFPGVKKVLGIPYIIQFHGGGMRHWKKWDGNRLFFKYAYKILAVSNTIKEEYEKRTGRTLEVVLPLVPYTNSEKTKEELKRNYGLLSEEKVMVMVGSIKPLKGNIWVYEEFKSLTSKFLEKHQLILFFVGKGSDSEKLKAIIKQDNMEYFVRIIDQIPNEIIHEVYGMADYYIIGSDFEGTPKSLLEAMYNRLPIIGTDVNGISTILKNGYNGLLVNKRINGELRKTIHHLLNDNNLASHIALNAKKTYQEKYDFSITLNQLSKIYYEVSNQPKLNDE